MTGTAPILGFEASVLFDSGATHSFVYIVFVRLSRLVVRTLELCKRVVCECPVSICRRVFPANLSCSPYV
jgi:hypothetical protein